MGVRPSRWFPQIKRSRPSPFKMSSSSTCVLIQMVCTPAEASLSMAMPTNNKSCNEVHTSFNSASHPVLVHLRTARTLQTAWVAVMVMSLSVEARSGGLSRPRTLSIKASQPRTVKITGRNLMGSRPITATIRLHRRATPTSKVTAVNSLRKGLNQPIGSR